MKIRKARKKDLKDLTELYIKYNKELSKIIPKKFQFFKNKKKNYKSCIKNSIKYSLNNKNSIILICKKDKKPIGTINGWINSVKNDLYNDKIKFGHLQYLFVNKNYRGKKISNKLKKELIKWFKKNKCDYIRLEVANSNPAKNLYKKWGFEEDSIKMIKKIK